MSIADLSWLSHGQDGKPKDLSRDNDFLSVALDSMRRIFTKSEDEYPVKEPALGFTQTPTRPQRNKVSEEREEEERECMWAPPHSSSVL